MTSRHYVLSIGLGIVVALLTLASVLYVRMAYYDHRHIDALCTRAVPPGFCDQGPGPAPPPQK